MNLAITICSCDYCAKKLVSPFVSKGGQTFCNNSCLERFEYVNKIKKLQNLCIDKNITTRHSVFYDFCGHINLLSIQVYRNGYYANYSTRKPIRFDIYLDEFYKVFKKREPIKGSLDRCLSFIEGLK